MKEDLLLVLAFYQGQGFCPKENHSIVVSARIDGHSLSTDPVPQTSEPKLSTEVSWKVDQKTLRRYKLSRVPVRIECHSVNKHNEKQSLGYIILNLSSVVQGIETDKKWHKLLGGNLQQSKVPSQILLSLNVQSLESREKVESDASKMLHNGGQYARNSVGNSLTNHVAQQNGGMQNANHEGHGHQMHGHHDIDFGALSKLGALLSDRSSNSQVHHLNSSTHDDDLYGDLSPQNVESPEKLDTSVDRYYDDEEELSYEEDDMEEDLDGEDSDELCKIEPDNSNKFDDVKKSVLPENSGIKVNRDKSETVNKNKNAFEHKNSEYSQNVKENNFRKFNGKIENANPKETISSPVAQAINMLGSIDGNVSSSHQHNADNNSFSMLSKGYVTGHGQYSGQTSSRPAGDGTRHMKYNYIPKDGAQSSQSGVHSSSAGRRLSAVGETLVPHLNNEGGFFQLGPATDPQQQTYEFAITMIFAKYLDQLLPQDYTWTSNSEACFSYSFLGCGMTSEPINNLHNPELQAERIAAKIHATPANLSNYFKENAEFPIHLIIGDLCLATASVNLSKFHRDCHNISSNRPLCIEGSYKMIPVITQPKATVAKEPVIGMIIQLSKYNKNNVSHRLAEPHMSSDSSDSEEESYHPHQQHSQRRRKYRSKSHNDQSMQDSVLFSTSSSSSDELFPKGKKQKCKNPFKSSSHKEGLMPITLQEYPDKSTLKKYLYNAALDVESWKDDQQSIFLKQWSSRENDLQRHLSDEWLSRIKSMESKARNRLAQIDSLYRKLKTGVHEMSGREKKLYAKEEKIRNILEDLEEQKEEQDLAEKETFEGRLRQAERLEHKSLLEDLVREKEMRKKLESENDKLHEALNQVDQSAISNHEAQKQISALKRENESLCENLTEALRKKQYYKAQWVQSVGELHHARTASVHHAEAMRSEMEMSSPEPYLGHHREYKRQRQRRYDDLRTPRRMHQSASRRNSRIKSGESLLDMKDLDPRSKEGDDLDEHNWMDQSTHPEVRNVDSVVSGASRNNVKMERTIDRVRGRSSKGNVNEYADEESYNVMRKNAALWRMGNK